MLLVKFIYFSSAFLSLLLSSLAFRERRNISCAVLRFLRTAVHSTYEDASRTISNGVGKVFKIIGFFTMLSSFLCVFLS